MLKQYGHKLTSLPWELKYERTLEYFEGDILVEYRAKGKSGFFIEKLCTSENEVYRYLIVRVDQRSIAEYLACKISLKSLLSAASDGGGFLVDKKENLVINTCAIRLDDLPPTYQPNESSLHDPELRPHWDIVPQNFLIAEDWDGKLIASIERQFFGVLGFLYFTEIKKKRKIPEGLFNFSYKGGFPIMHLFNALRAKVPMLELAWPAGVSAASPGVMTFETQSDILNHLNNSIEAVIRNRDLYLAVQSWAKLSQPKVIQGVHKLPPSAYGDLEIFAKAMHVEISSLFPSASKEIPNPTKNPRAILVAGKLITAHYRRISKLISAQDRIEFLSDRLSNANFKSSLIDIDHYEEIDESDDIDD